MSQTLEKELFKSVEKNTPDYIKNNKYIDIDKKEEFTFTLKRTFTSLWWKRESRRFKPW